MWINPFGIHIEVQGYHDKLFARRMFTYFCRILDRFKMEVASMAIFSDSDRSYRPDRYEYRSLETSNVYRFKTYKIKGQDRAALENSDNPFSIVILTVLIALEKKNYRPEEVYDLSIDLARRLLEKGFSRRKINSLLYFLSTYVFFDNQEMFSKFDREVSLFVNKEKSMGIKELATKLIREYGIEEGREAAKIAFISNLLVKTKHSFSLQEIAELANSTVDLVIEVKNKLSAGK